MSVPFGFSAILAIMLSRRRAVRMSLWCYAIESRTAFPAIVLVMVRGDLPLAWGLFRFWHLGVVTLLLVPPALLVPLWAVLTVWAWVATRRHGRCITSRCCGPARVASVCCPAPRPAPRVALPATERHPLSGGSNLADETLRHALSEWTDWDGAAYRLAVSLGLVQDEPGVFQVKAKHIFWSSNLVGNTLYAILEQLVAAQILELREEPDKQFRWNSKFDGTPESAG